MDDFKSFVVFIGAIDKFVLINALHLESLPLVLVDAASHPKAIVEQLLSDGSLARLRVLKHASQEAHLIEFALLNLLQVKVLL